MTTALNLQLLLLLPALTGWSCWCGYWCCFEATEGHAAYSPSLRALPEQNPGASTPVLALTLSSCLTRVGWFEWQPQPLTLTADVTVGSTVLCRLLTATGMEVTTATNKTVPGSGDVGCSGEGSSMVDTGTTAHIGKCSWETHQLHGVSQVC